MFTSEKSMTVFLLKTVLSASSITVSWARAGTDESRSAATTRSFFMAVTLSLGRIGGIRDAAASGRDRGSVLRRRRLRLLLLLLLLQHLLLLLHHLAVLDLLLDVRAL